MGSVSDKFSSMISHSAEASEQINELSDNKKAQKKESTSNSNKSALAKLASGDKESKTSIFQNSLSLLQTTGKKTNQKLQESVNRQIEQQIFGREESFEDQVKLSAFSQLQEQTKTKNKQKKQETSEQESLKDTKEKTFLDSSRQQVIGQKAQKEITKNKQRQTSSEFARMPKDQAQKALKDYSSALAQHLINQSPQQKQKMQDIKRSLQQSGFSTKSLAQMESKVSNMVRQHIIIDMKDQLLKYFFSKSGNNWEQLMGKKNLSDFLSNIKGNQKLGGADFGGYKGGVMPALGEQASILREEIGGFVMDEATDLVSKYLGAKGDTDKLQEELTKLQKFCIDSCGGIDIKAISKRINKSIEDLGLSHFIPPEDQNSSFNFSEGDQRGKSKQDQTIYLNQEDQLMDKLRNLYFQRSLNPSIKETISLAFKIRKIRNQLLKVGIIDKEKNQELENQGIFLATEKLLSELHQTFIEQATLHKLEGPSYDIIKSKKAFLIKSLRKIGHKIKGEDLKQMQDSANREMFSILKEDYLKLEMVSEVKETIQASQKRKMMLEILNRLKEESNIKDSSIESAENLSSGSTIVEAA